MMNRVRAFSTGLLLLGAAACLSVHVRHPLETPRQGHPVTVAWFVRLTAAPAHLSELETLSEETALTPEEEQARIQDRMAEVTATLQDQVARHLASLQGIQFRPKAAEGPGVDADLELEISLSGYGRLKRKWIRWMLISGAFEAVFQGVVAASVLNSTWAGVAVGVEEMGGEWLTWHGGAFLYARTFSPVTLEGHMVRLHDGKTVWRKTELVSRDKKALSRLPAQEQARKETRLRLHLDKAERLLFRDLDTYLAREHLYTNPNDRNR